MIDDGKVELAEQVGCWVTCHHDSRYMPDEPAADVSAGATEVTALIDVSGGITKYTQGSRTEMEYKGKEGKPRGSWDKMIAADELAAKLESGAYMELMRYRSGGGSPELGYVLGDRELAPSDAFTAEGSVADGVWTVVVRRPLAAIQPGGVAFRTRQHLHHRVRDPRRLHQRAVPPRFSGIPLGTGRRRGRNQCCQSVGALPPRPLPPPA